MASRCWMGLEETSTIEALPCLSRWVKSLIFYLCGAGGGFHPFADDGAHLFGGLHSGLDEFWREPWEHADEVVGDEDLAVAIGTGADAYCGDVDGGGDFFGDGWGDE